tara:strand:- start:5578 stop:5880 length:303 start_codon:yes stop_codon:yes gene_type:complete
MNYLFISNERDNSMVGVYSEGDRDCLINYLKTVSRICYWYGINDDREICTYNGAVVFKSGSVPMISQFLESLNIEFSIYLDYDEEFEDLDEFIKGRLNEQ